MKGCWKKDRQFFDDTTIQSFGGIGRVIVWNDYYLNILKYEITNIDILQLGLLMMKGKTDQLWKNRKFRHKLSRG